MLIRIHFCKASGRLYHAQLSGAVEIGKTMLYKTLVCYLQKTCTIFIAELASLPRKPLQQPKVIVSNIFLSYQTFVFFPRLFYLLNLCCFINFCHLINLSQSYQTSVIFSPLVITSHFTLYMNLINVPAQHITHTTLFPVLSCARSLR